MTSYSQYSIRHPGRTLLIWAAIIGLGGFVLAFKPQMKLDPTFRSMIMPTDPDLATDHRAKELFGDDELIIVAVDNPGGVFNIPTLTYIDRLTAEFEKIEGVREVYSLTRADNIRGADGMLLTDDLITDLPTTPEEVQRVEREAFENPLYVKNLVAPDKKVAGINIEPALAYATSKHQARMTEEVYAIIEKHAAAKPAGVTVYVTGYPVVSYSGGIFMLKDMVIFGGAAFSILAFVMWLVFRCWQGVVGTLAVVMSAVTVSYAAMTLIGQPVTMPLSSIMVFLTAIGMQYATYVGFAHREQVRRERAAGAMNVDHRHSLSESLVHVRGSVIMSAITTAIGFGSMYANRVPDLKVMGVFLVVGLVTAALAVMTILPAVLARWPFEIPQRERLTRVQGAIDRLGRLSVTRPWTMLAIAVALFAGGVFGFTQLSTNSDGMSWFKDSAHVKISDNFVRARLAGSTYLQAVVSAPEVDAFKHPENLRKLQAIQEYAETLPHITKTISHADHMRLMNRALKGGGDADYRIPDTKQAVEQYLLLHNEPDDFRLVIDSDYQNANIMVRMDTMQSALFRTTERQLEDFMAKQFPGWKVNLVGTNLLTHRAFDEMATSMILSLGIATGLIWLVMIIGLGSIKLGTLSLIPNLAPSILIYSILPIIDKPLDPPTAVTGAIALGILADDTVHFFRTWLARRKAPDATDVTAVTETLSEIGKPMVLSSIVVCVGFSIMLFSSYGTLVWIGFMLVVVVAMALIWELVCTPSMLRLIGKHKPGAPWWHRFRSK